MPRVSKPVPAPRRLIRKPEVRRLTGYSDDTLWRKEKELVDPFPRRVQLSPMAVAWFEDEVQLWIAARVRQAGKRPSVQLQDGPKGAAPSGVDAKKATAPTKPPRVARKRE